MIKIECDTKEEYFNLLKTLADDEGSCPFDDSECHKYREWRRDAYGEYGLEKDCRDCVQSEIEWIIEEE